MRDEVIHMAAYVDVVQELIAAEHESASSSERFNHDEVMKELRAKIKDSKNDE